MQEHEWSFSYTTETKSRSNFLKKSLQISFLENFNIIIVEKQISALFLDITKYLNVGLAGEK